MKKLLISFTACLMILVMCAGLVQPVFADGIAPLAENMELKTYKNTSVSGMLAAYDPETDVVGFKITTEPTKGTIQLEQNGSFIYTPNKDKKGRDYFGYKAVDAQGNESHEATVIIRIEKQKKGVQYSDMENNAAEYAAVNLSAKGFFTGEKIGNEYYFDPQKTVSCVEFYSICSEIFSKDFKYTGTENLSASISEVEAVKLLNEMLGTSDINYVKLDYEPEESIVQACMNLSALGVIDRYQPADDELSREAAALMLVKAIEILDKR